MHDEDCALALDVQLPRVSVKRGGIHYPRFRVETLVKASRRRFLRRRTWQVHVRYWEPSQHRYLHHIMEGFPTKELAVNAQQIIRFLMMNVNEQYHEERNARDTSC